MERYEPYWNRQEHDARLRVLYNEMKAADRERNKLRRLARADERRGLASHIRQIIRMADGIREVPPR